METFPRFSLIPIVIGGWLEICHVPPIIASLPAAKRILHKEALAMAKRNSFFGNTGRMCAISFKKILLKASDRPFIKNFLWAKSDTATAPLG